MKLTEDQRTEIRVKFQLGMRKAAIAKQFGLSWSAVEYIVNPERARMVLERAKAQPYNPVANKKACARWQAKKRKEIVG